jgi:hypothetical protein
MSITKNIDKKYLTVQIDVFAKEKEEMQKRFNKLNSNEEIFVSSDNWPWPTLSNNHNDIWRNRRNVTDREYLKSKFAKYKGKFGLILAWIKE